MSEKRIITFTPQGVGAGVAFLPTVPEGAHVLPDAMTSNLASRYHLDPGGQIVDVFAGKTDEEVAAILLEREIQEAAQLRALKQGHDITTIEGARAFKVKQVREHFNRLIEGLKADAAPYEVETWGVQRDEYARWVADPAASTPYVDGLCAGRGVPKEVLMPKIGIKVAGLASIQGMQHALEKEVEAAQSIEDVMAVAIPGA